MGAILLLSATANGTCRCGDVMNASITMLFLTNSSSNKRMTCGDDRARILVVSGWAMGVGVCSNVDEAGF